MGSPSSSVTRAASAERRYDDEEKASSAHDTARDEKQRPRSTEDEGELELPSSADLRTKDTILIKKRWWLKTPREPYPSLEEVPVAPLQSANFLSKITFHCEFLAAQGRCLGSTH